MRQTGGRVAKGHQKPDDLGVGDPRCEVAQLHLGGLPRSSEQGNAVLFAGSIKIQGTGTAILVVSCVLVCV